MKRLPAILLAAVFLVQSAHADEGLVAHWKFDEGAGNLAMDSSGNGNDGTVFESSRKSGTACITGKCLAFDGINDYAVFGNKALFNFSQSATSFTLSAWIKTNSTERNNIVAKGACSSPGYRLRIGALNNPGAADFFLNDNSGNIMARATSSRRYDDGKWHYVIAVNDAGNLSLYVDGEKAGSAATPLGKSIASDAPLAVGIAFSSGTSICGSEYFNGVIDDVKIYNRALREGDIRRGNLSRPNILLILLDDAVEKRLGFTGDPVAKTPNIDALAKGGVSFSNAFVTYPQCCPSRASLLSGKYPHRVGVASNGDQISSLDELVLPELLKKNSYEAAIVGKMHVYPVEQFGNLFNYKAIFPPGYDDPGKLENFSRFYFIRSGESSPAQIEGKYATDFLTDEAIDYLKEKRAADKPFFLYLAHVAPHPLGGEDGIDAITLDPPPGPNPFSAADMPLPSSISDDLSSKPKTQQESINRYWYSQVLSQGGNEALKQRLAAYYYMMLNIDENVGRLLEVLRGLGITNNTVVVLLSDNGAMFGEHQLYQKGPELYEELIRTPLVFYNPKIFPPSSGNGKQINRLVSEIDVAPTILQLAGLQIPADLDGKSLLPLINNTSIEWRDSLFFEHNAFGAPNPLRTEYLPLRSVRDSRYKWVNYLNDTDEFYDLQNDPYEVNNLINSSSVRPVLKQLRRKMARFQTESQDHFGLILTGLKAETASNEVKLSFKSRGPRPCDKSANWQQCDPPDIVNLVDKPGNVEIEYWEEGKPETLMELVNDSISLAHNQTLSGLKSSTSYILRIYSMREFGNGGFAEITVKTLSPQPQLNFNHHWKLARPSGGINIDNFKNSCGSNSQIFYFNSTGRLLSRNSGTLPENEFKSGGGIILKAETINCSFSYTPYPSISPTGNWYIISPSADFDISELDRKCGTYSQVFYFDSNDKLRTKNSGTVSQAEIKESGGLLVKAEKAGCMI
ncbi:MAG: sulfatase-like hydrolase/transferase [Candidatus Aenigmarchaeota archaeon]|nr:sulfatase-like hydrolase/transferase [Candidatus Aenigmarchaeota archaeon]